MAQETAPRLGECSIAAPVVQGIQSIRQVHESSGHVLDSAGIKPRLTSNRAAAGAKAIICSRRRWYSLAAIPPWLQDCPDAIPAFCIVYSASLSRSCPIALLASSPLEERDVEAPLEDAQRPVRLESGSRERLLKIISMLLKLECVFSVTCM
jgi:hypothetical protein